MKVGDVVFVRTSGIISNLIRYFDKGRFNHVAIFTSSTEIEEAQYNTKVNIVPFQYDDYEVIKIPYSDDDLLELQRLTKRFKGKSYDFKEIFKIWLSIIFHYKKFRKFNSPKQVICVELVARILVHLGKAEKSTIDMTPNEFYRYLKGKYPK